MTSETTSTETKSWIDLVNPRALPLRQKIGVIAVVILGALPFIVEPLTVLKLTGALYFAVFAMSWDFTSGYTGEISFGHAFFFALGGYTSAALNVHQGMDPLLTIPIGVIIAALGGLALGGPALRLRGPYLSLITMIAPLILMKIFVVESEIFGGEVGIIGVQNLSVNPRFNYYLAFGIFVSVLVLFFAITRSDAGSVFTAIREDEDTVVASGINPAKFKLFSFVLSAAIGGLGGALFVHSSVGSATPNQLVALSVNISVIAATVIGGMGTIIGAAAGGVAFYMFRNYLSNTDMIIPLLDISVAHVDLILFYSFAVLVMYFLPEGIIPWAIEKSHTVLGDSDEAVAADGGMTPLEQARRKFRESMKAWLGGDQE